MGQLSQAYCECEIFLSRRERKKNETKKKRSYSAVCQKTNLKSNNYSAVVGWDLKLGLKVLTLNCIVCVCDWGWGCTEPSPAHIEYWACDERDKARIPKIEQIARSGLQIKLLLQLVILYEECVSMNREQPKNNNRIHSKFFFSLPSRSVSLVFSSRAFSPFHYAVRFLPSDFFSLFFSPSRPWTTR